MNFTKIVKVDLNSPHRELFNGDLGIAVALSVFGFSTMVFRVFILKEQSSCRVFFSQKLHTPFEILKFQKLIPTNM